MPCSSSLDWVKKTSGKELATMQFAYAFKLTKTEWTEVTS
jgi:hypothetical protein